MSMRLEPGVELRKGVLGTGGTDEDIALVLEERPDLFAGFGGQVVETARIIRGDRDCFRLMDEAVVIEIPALKRPTLAEVQASWSHIKKIERDDSLEGPVTLRLATVRKSTEPSVDGPTYERRTQKLRDEGKLFGFQQRQWLIANQDNEKAIPDPKVRVALNALIGQVYVDFSGLIVVDADDDRCIPCASISGRRWYGFWHSIGSSFYSCGRIAVSGK